MNLIAGKAKLSLANQLLNIFNFKANNGILIANISALKSWFTGNYRCCLHPVIVFVFQVVIKSRNLRQVK